MPTFARGTVASLPARHIAFHERRAAAKALATELAASEPPTQKPKSVRYAPDPMTVRGIPAVGRNCPGHIAGTQPEHHTCR